MSEQRKCSLEESSVIELDTPCSDSPTKKHSIQKKTVEKGITENYKELNTSIWLKYDNCSRMATLKYSASN